MAKAIPIRAAPFRRGRRDRLLLTFDLEQRKGAHRLARPRRPKRLPSSNGEPLSGCRGDVRRARRRTRPPHPPWHARRPNPAVHAFAAPAYERGCAATSKTIIHEAKALAIRHRVGWRGEIENGQYRRVSPARSRRRI